MLEEIREQVDSSIPRMRGLEPFFFAIVYMEMLFFSLWWILC